MISVRPLRFITSETLTKRDGSLLSRSRPSSISTSAAAAAFSGESASWFASDNSSRADRQGRAVDGRADARRRLRAALRRRPRELRVAELELHLLRRQSQVLGGDHGHHRVGAGADVAGRADDVRRAVGAQRDAGAGGPLERAPDAGGHPPADQPAPVAHRAGLGLAVLPSELLRAEPVALPQRLARQRLAALGVHLGVVDEAQLQRIDLQRVGQLVHRAFEREHAADGPGARIQVGVWRSVSAIFSGA